MKKAISALVEHALNFLEHGSIKVSKDQNNLISIRISEIDDIDNIDNRPKAGIAKDLSTKKVSNAKNISNATSSRPKNLAAINTIEKFFIEKDSTNYEAHRFFNYYESNGWKVGKNPMKNWKAAANGWILRLKKADNNVRSNTGSGRPGVDSTYVQDLRNRLLGQPGDNGKGSGG